MKIKILFAFLITLSISSFSQTKTNLNDSLRIYNSKEITVTATRTEVLRENSPSDIEVITGIEISNSLGTKLSDKISGISGIILKDYGFNGMKTLSMRGMGSEHTLILYNGEKLNSYQNGGFDLNSFIVEDIERIEILKSGSSAFYGSDAIAGVINIIPKSSYKDFGFSTSYSLGSYDYNRFYLNLEKRLSGLMLHTSILNERSRNNFDYEFDDNGDTYKGKRGNSDFSNKQLILQLNSNPSEQTSFSLNNKYILSERGVPDIVIASISKARQKDEEIISTLNVKTVFSNKFHFSITPTFHYSRQRYIDPKFDQPDKIYESISKNNIFSASSQLEYLYSDNLVISSGAEYNNITVSSNNYSKPNKRTQYALYLLSNIKALETIPLFLYPAIRYDHYSDFGDHISPKFGINIHLFEKELLFRSSYSGNFRAPTFNDLYWNPGGNPYLKPESAKSFDCGIDYSVEYLGNNNININYFDIRVKERILWLPYSGTIWKPKNVQDVHSEGIEISFTSRQLNNKLSFNINYNYLISKNVTLGDNNYNHDLPYIPNHILKASANLELNKFGMGFDFDIYGDRYSVESNESSSILPYYDNTNVYAFYNFDMKSYIINIKAEAGNLLNSKYAVLPYYPTSLRNFKLTLSIQY